MVNCIKSFYFFFQGKIKWKKEQLHNCIRCLYCSGYDINFKNIIDWFGENILWSYDSRGAAKIFTELILKNIEELTEIDEIHYNFDNYLECEYQRYDEENSNNCSNF